MWALIKPGTQSGISKVWVITLQKTVKYYTYCKRNYHSEDECHDKYHYFKEAKIATAKPGIKQWKNRKLVKDKQVDNNLGQCFYFIQPKLGSFIAIIANPFLYKLWNWNTEISWHFIYARKLLFNF